MTHDPTLFGLYVHWPFCLSKCPYCDFNSHVQQTIDEELWLKSYLKALDLSAQFLPHGRLGSVFFGGGTPSLMPPVFVEKILDRARGLWQEGVPSLEVTLEANPSTVELQKLKDFAQAGVNRLSMGIQSIDDQALKFLGRAHDSSTALKALDQVRKTFQRYSFDLIYARPEQTVAQWVSELTSVLPFVGSHLSVYQLTIEPGTAFATRHGRGDFAIPEEELAAEFYDVTQEILEAEGMPAYEVSNHARPGHECAHNLIYWRGQDYLGIGPGAHGRLTQGADRWSTAQARAPETWIKEMSQDAGIDIWHREALTSQQRVFEFLMMGFRMREGFSVQWFEQQTGVAFTQVMPEEKRKKLVEELYLAPDETHVALTSEGMKRLNGIVRWLL